MKTYENNMADQALVVKSLKVLDKVEGGAFKEIKQNVESVRKQTNAISRQQDEYWKTLSDDGIITPIEKQSLLRESKNIDRSFAAITQQAATLGIASAILDDYVDTYDALHAYLFTTLKLFDDMQSETQIDDRDTFNAYFSGYYFSENFVLLAITAGILDTIDFRVLQSLTEPGEEGETAIYHGALYQYVNGQWKNVTTGAYKGPRTELPADEEEAFFIVSESFTMSESLIVNDEELLVNGDTLLVTHTYLKGYIYYFQAGTWHPEWDKTNWRYAAAFADVLNITGELPQIFQDGLDAIQANLDAAVLTLEDEIAAKQGQYTIIGGEMVLIDDLLPQIIEDYNEQQSQIDDQQTEIDTKVDHLPVYYGGTSVAPGSPQEGDFYLFTGSGENNCKVRRYHNAAWEWLDPTNTNYRNYYMMALQDILSNTNAGTATFSNAFAGSFWTAWANMTTLEVKTIYLRNGGTIQSDNLTYVPETRGTRLDYYGNFDANGDTHLGGKVAIGVPLSGNTDLNTNDVVIGGNALIKSGVTIKGNLDGATGTFSGALSGGSFTGTFVFADYFVFHNLQAGDLICKTFQVRDSSALSRSSYSYTWRPWAKTSTSKVIIGIDLGGRWTGRGSGTVYATAYIKRNGTASSSDYDYSVTFSVTETWTHESDYDYEYKTSDINIDIVNETDYFNIQIVITGVSGAVDTGGFKRVTMSIGYNKYLPLLGIINEIS